MSPSLEGGFNSPNHLGDNPDGMAEIVFGTLHKHQLGELRLLGMEQETATCSNVYCHGDFEIE
ncbi:MAG: CxxxxCH/CxxCH domain-containing protein [Ignavibacteria bacterium]|nr:CxxxxCH/CxxCH domain-containing protein [Ignavibacteria bacterium]